MFAIILKPMKQNYFNKYNIWTITGACHSEAYTHRAHLLATPSLICL